MEVILPVFMSWRNISLSAGQEVRYFGSSQYTVRPRMHHQMQGAPPDNQAEPHWTAISPIALILDPQPTTTAVGCSQGCAMQFWARFLVVLARKLFTVCMTWFADPMQDWRTFLWAFCHSSGREVNVLIFAGGVS